ncbi:alpha/beta fold hydrolase [Enterovibrio coralii]|uniref:Alpha/beta hydrolase n=1 Tax=Enterovibrio coralii TaxID=294935 RepID=A0A135IDM2_9GAMM|nr:alpha/beta hydrolase [Enterovibrio coralii]KXF83549.1 alpha/beta hydrolase [Enterovibrio coralii]
MWIVIGFILLLVVIYALTPNRVLFQNAVKTERRIAKLSRKSVTISDGEMVYLEGGSGTPLLLLHGFGADKDNWVRMAKHLTSQYHVIAPDLPGFGESLRDDNLDYDVSPQVARLHQFVEVLNLSKCHIAGNSMGSYLAGNFASTHPDKVVTVCLLNPLGVATSPDSEMFALLRKRERPTVLVADDKQYRELLDFAFFKPPFIPGFVVEELAIQAKDSFPLHEKIFQDIHHMSEGQPHFSQPLEQTLTTLTAPTLIIWGDHDRILHPAGAEILQGAMPDAKSVVLKNMGHLPMIEAPSATARLILDFIQNEKP